MSKEYMELINTMEQCPRDALCSPVCGIQTYARKRTAGVYKLHEKWVAFQNFTALDQQSGAELLGYIRLVIPTGSIVVVCRDSCKEFGIPYRIRTNQAVIDAIFVEVEAESGIFTKTLTSINDKSQQIYVGHCLSLVNDIFNMDHYDVNGCGIVIQPTVKECLRVGEFVAQKSSPIDDDDSDEDDEGDEEDFDTADETKGEDEGDEDEPEEAVVGGIEDPTALMSGVVRPPKKPPQPVHKIVSESDEDESDDDEGGEVITK
jgi:hypothetical protein